MKFNFLLFLFLIAGCGVEKQFNRFIDDLRDVQDSFKIELSLGNFRVIIVDAPFAYKSVKKANIKVTQILMRDSTGTDVVAFTGEKLLNLVELRNGGYAIVTDLDLPAADYTHINLTFSEASVELSDGRILPITLPVGVINGVRVALNETVTVTANGKSDVLVDIDLSKSFLPRGSVSDLGAVTGFDFFPVMRAVSYKGTGQIGGKIVNQLKKPIAGAIVEVSQGTVSSTTITNDDGTYLVVGLPLADYKISLKADGHQDRSNLDAKVEKAEMNYFSTYLLKLP